MLSVFFVAYSNGYYYFSRQHRYMQAKLNISDRAAKVRSAFMSFHTAPFSLRYYCE